jgi:parvulin-like peptidyl-prolyl isomerase
MNCPLRRILLPFGVLALMASAPLLSRAQEVLDGVAAQVNQEVITFSQVRELVGAREKQARETLRGQEMVEKIKEIRLQAVNDLIDRQLIIQEFREIEKKGASIPTYVVEDRIQAIIREEFGGDRNAFTRTLAAQGYTLDRFRQLEQEKIIVQAMRAQQVKPNVIISESKVKEAYRENIAEYTSEEQVKLRMVVLRGANDGRRKMMEEIREKVAGGAAFEDLARMYSEDSNQEQGGDWGWINRKTLNETLTKVAFGLKPGQVSKIVEQGDSLYLLYCEAKKAGTTKPLSEVRGDLEKKLIQAERQKAQQEWINKLRKKAFIKIF